MRLVFGVLSLLLVAAIVMMVMRGQLRALAPAAAPPGTAASAARALPKQVADDVGKLMQQAPARGDAPAQ